MVKVLKQARYNTLFHIETEVDMKSIAIQEKFRYEIPDIRGNKDFEVYKSLLERIDEILEQSKLEDLVFQKRLADLFKKESKPLTQKQLNYSREKTIQGFRCELARQITSHDFRSLSIRLGESFLLQRFCKLNHFNTLRIPGKSQLQNYSTWFSEADLQEFVQTLLRSSFGETGAARINLDNPIGMELLLADSTCLSCHIHFPVDWVLLRDAIRSIIKSVLVIRSHGLKHRILTPEKFINRINKLSIQMTHTRRKKGSKKARKEVFRQMKKLSKTVADHGKRYIQLLLEKREETDLSEKQAQQVIGRIQSILNQLPQAIEQAHERIIGERQIESKNKILSLYEPDTHVITRGKSGAEVEFGNTLHLIEQKNGLIVDWELLKEISPGDASLLIRGLKITLKTYSGMTIEDVSTDRGYSAKKVEDYLLENNIGDQVAPKNIDKFIEKNQTEKFKATQKRRSQTEARIAILKNKFIGNPVNSKGINNQKIRVGFSVLGHNLWVLARLPQKEQQLIIDKAA